MGSTSASVGVAHCIWDAVFIETGGLGNAHYVRRKQTRSCGAHPDDWGCSQDPMYNHLMLCTNQAAAIVS